MKSDADRDVVQRKRARCEVGRSKRNFRSKSVASGSVRLAGSICEGARQFDVNSGSSFNQPDRYVQRSLSSFSGTLLASGRAHLDSLEPVRDRDKRVMLGWKVFGVA